MNKKYIIALFFLLYYTIIFAHSIVCKYKGNHNHIKNKIHEKKSITHSLFLTGTFAGSQVLNDSEILELRGRLTVKFKGDAQIEVGGPYVGLEFHHVSPHLQRISFYYPSANSIDNSTDYWYRDTTHILSIKLKRNSKKYEEISNEICEHYLTPYRVSL